MATGGTPVLLEKTLLERTLRSAHSPPGDRADYFPCISAPHRLKERTASPQGAHRTGSRSAGVPPVSRHDIRRGAPTDGNRRDAGAP